jgi:hypothetical protein
MLPKPRPDMEDGSNGIDLSFLSGIAKASPDFLYQIILPAKLCRGNFLGAPACQASVPRKANVKYQINRWE